MIINKEKDKPLKEKLLLMKKAEYWKRFLLKNYKVGSTAISMNIGRGQNFYTEGCAGIAEGLQQVPGLKKFNLEIGDANKIGVQGCQFLGQALKDYELQELSFIFGEELEIMDQGVLELFQHLNTSKTLVSFEFEISDMYSDVSQDSGKHLKQFLKKQINLQTLKLRLYNWTIGNGGLQFITESISELRKITYLQFIEHDCFFTLKGLKNLFEAIQKLKGLQILQFSIPTSTFLQKKQQKKDKTSILEGISPLCDMINSLPDLYHLEVYIPDQYKMSLGGAQKLGDCLRKNQKLTTLVLIIEQFTNAGQNGMRELIDGIRYCKNLKKLNYYIKCDPKFKQEEVNRSIKHNLRLVECKKYFSVDSYKKDQSKLL